MTAHGPSAVPGGRGAPTPEWADIPALDWQGQPLDCASCRHADLHAAGGCEPGRACVQDAYARRIDRFFFQHPAQANEHLDHPYFEVRAVAARRADLFRLPALMRDPDETVRLQVALRLPQRLLRDMVQDEHREVRIRVAQRLDTDQLAAMLHDEDYQVRATVARRLPEALLPILASDRDEIVRREVAQRVPMPALWRMAQDKSAEVRRIVAERLPAALLDTYIDDPDLLVRWEAAGRASGAVLARFAQDAEADIRDKAQQRLAELQIQQLPSPEPHHG